MAYEGSALAQILGLAGEYVRGEVRVSLASNLLPEIPIFRGSLSRDGGGASGGAGGGSGSLARIMGIRAGVIVRNERGDVLARYGDPAPVDPLRATVLALIVAGLGYVFVRGLIR